MAFIWLLDCSLIPAFFIPHDCVRPDVPFERRCFTPFTHSIHQRLASIRRTSQDFSRSLLRQNIWRQFPLSRLLRGARFPFCRRQLITRSATLWLHSVTRAVLAVGFRSAVWKNCNQSRLLLSSLSFPDGPATQFPSQPCHLSPSGRLRLDHGGSLRPLACSRIA